MMEGRGTLRDEVIERFRAAFGEPEESRVKSGSIFRWTLSRGPYQVSMFITIDSPEFDDIAHVMISDAVHHQVEPVVAVSIRTLEETEAVIERIKKQWREG